AAQDGGATLAASDLGRLNAFFRASPSGLLHAAPHSAVGQVSKIYAGQLQAYLDAYAVNPNSQQTQDTFEGLESALAKAANKPVNPDIVAAINDRLTAGETLTPVEQTALARLSDGTTSFVDNVNALINAKPNQGLGGS